MRASRAALVLVVACGTTGADQPDGASPDPDAPPDAPPFIDRDGDGLDDDFELEVANRYLPFLSLDPDDGCNRSGLLVRVRKHPADPEKLLIVYDHLFERDCGLGGHVGDNEVFAIAVDPRVPAPAGIEALKTASHQNTACERITQCSTCGANDSRPACDLANVGGAMWPMLYPSKDKHGQYATKAQCPLLGTCFDQCTVAPTAHRPPIANAGEPGMALVTNLTTQAFINTTNGWTEAAVMNIDPWAPGDFGGAGNIADDLVDPVFVPAPCP